MDGGIYSGEASDLTYRPAARTRAGACSLPAGRSSSTPPSSSARRRDVFRALAASADAPFFILAPQATPAQLRSRLLHRLAQGRDASEATLAVLGQQLQRIEPLGEDERDWQLKA
jgi:predicted kinase